MTVSVSGNDTQALAYIVTSGTGRFATAKGNGTLTLNYASSGRLSEIGPLCCVGHSDLWSGKLKY